MLTGAESGWAGLAFAVVAIGGVALLALALGSELRAAERLSRVTRRWAALRGHAQRLPYGTPVRPWCLKLKSGAYLAALSISAPDGDSMDPETLGQSDARLSKGVQAIDPECAAWFVYRRVRVRGYDRPPAGSVYPHPIAEGLDELQAAYFNAGRTLASSRTLFVAWKPPSEASERIRAAATVGEENAVRTEDDIIADFERNHLEAFETYFATAGATVRRLSRRRESDRDGDEHWYSELYSALSYSVAHVTRRFRLPDCAEQSAAGVLAMPEFRGGFKVRVGAREFAFVVVKGYPDELWPRKLSRLKELGIEYSLVVRWLPLRSEVARKKALDARAGWMLNSGAEAGGNEHSEQMKNQSARIQGVISKNHVNFGEASVWVVLSARDRKTVDDSARKVVTLLDDIGIKAFAATLTAEGEYMGQLPGVVEYGVRKHPLHSVNVAHLVNFHEESTGRRYSESPTMPAYTPAVATVVTPEAEPYRIHLSAEPRDVLMGFGVGGMGKGKSVSLATLAALTFGRMPFAGVSISDKGRSSYRLTQFLDGTFTDFLKPGAAQPGMALYDHLEDAEDRGPLLQILNTMIEMHGVPMTVGRDDALSNALDALKSFDPEKRSHSALCELVQDPTGAIKTALRAYTRDRELGLTLDCEQDTFDVGRWNVVEMDRLLRMSPEYVVPTLMAIYWKMRAQVRRMKKSTGRHDLHWYYHQDEAHALLEQSKGAQFVKTMFREARRENLSLFQWSQSMGHYVFSECWQDINTACGVRFFFGNPALAEPEVQSSSGIPSLHQQYRMAGVPERGIRMLGRMPPFTFLYVTNDGEMKRGRFHLDDASKAILARTRASDNERVDEFMARFGADWRWELLKYEGVGEHVIARLRDLYDVWKQDGGHRRSVGGDLEDLLPRGDVA